MDSNNWRTSEADIQSNQQQQQPPMDMSGGGGGGGDWRSQLPIESRQRIVNKIMETLKCHLPISGQEGYLELKKIAVRFEEKSYTAATSQRDYLRKISMKLLSMETKSQNQNANSMPSNSVGNGRIPQDPAFLDSTAETGNANGGDWQEEVYQKIITMKDLYFPELMEMYQKIAAKLQQHDSLPHQPKTEQLEKLKLFKTMLERMITYLQVSKNNITPIYKEKLGAYEKQIVYYLNTNRPKKPNPSMQQGQFPPSHMHSMQQSQQAQSQNVQLQPHENQVNPRLQAMNLQGSGATMQKSNLTNMQHSSMSSLSIRNDDGGHHSVWDSQPPSIGNDEIWRPQFGTPPNLLTLESSLFSVIDDDMDVARGLMTPRDRFTVNSQSPLRHKKRVVMLGASNEDELERIQEMENALRVTEELLQVYKDENVNMERKHKLSEASLVKQLEEAKTAYKREKAQGERAMIAAHSEKERADLAEGSASSAKTLYEQAARQATFYRDENARLLVEVSICRHTITAKERALNSLSLELQQQTSLTNAAEQKIQGLSSHIKAEVNAAVEVAQAATIIEDTRKINAKAVECNIVYHDALDNNNIVASEDQPSTPDPVCSESPPIPLNCPEIEVVDLEGLNDSNADQAFVQVQPGLIQKHIIETHPADTTSPLPSVATSTVDQISEPPPPSNP